MTTTTLRSRNILSPSDPSKRGGERRIRRKRERPGGRAPGERPHDRRGSFRAAIRVVVARPRVKQVRREPRLEGQPGDRPELDARRLLGKEERREGPSAGRRLGERSMPERR